jgi:hypothetical protein
MDGGEWDWAKDHFKSIELDEELNEKKFNKP